MTEHARGDPAEREAREGEATSGRAEAMRWFSRGVGIATGAALVVAIAATLLVAWRVVILVFLAVLLGSALEPIVGRLRLRLPIPRGAAILIVYAVFFVAVAALLLIVLPSGIDQASQLGSAAPGALERARGWADGLSPAVLSTSANTLIDVVAGALQPGAPPQPGQIVEAGLTVVDVVVSTVTVLALIYFWMTERARLQRFALSFLPGDRRGEVHDAWNRIEVRLGGGSAANCC